MEEFHLGQASNLGQDLKVRETVHAFFAGRAGVIATMHGKERVITPLLGDALGITLTVPSRFDTDRFGTFTGDVARAGNQVEALRTKAIAAMGHTGSTIGISSEGSFGPHPLLPFATLNVELVLLLDSEKKLELIGEASTMETNYARRAVRNLDEALDFAYRSGFPSHAIVVKVNELNNSPRDIAKGLITETQLAHALQVALGKSTTEFVWVETDMRAHLNPLRMSCVGAATRDLVDRVYNLCPQCGWPGTTTVQKRGLPCGWCGEATEQVSAVEHLCRHCGYSTEEVSVTRPTTADPRWCNRCNP